MSRFVGETNFANTGLSHRIRKATRNRRSSIAETGGPASTTSIEWKEPRGLTRASLLTRTALGTVLGVGAAFLMMPTQALAANECGPIPVTNTVTCTGAFPAGITYVPGAGGLTVQLNGATPINDSNVAGIDIFAPAGGPITVVDTGAPNSIVTTNAHGIWLESGSGALTGGTLTIGDRATGAGVGGPITASGGVNVFGQLPMGIRLDSHGGNIFVTTASTDTIQSVDDGIRADARGQQGVGGNIDIQTNASITSTGGDGIEALTNNSGSILIVTNAPINAGRDGVEARSEEGNITLRNTQPITAVGNGMTGISTDGGNVNITVDSKISSNGFIGAGALSVGGSATVTVNAPIDPPLIGAGALTIGGGNATVNVNANIDATAVGAIAVNVLGGGSAIVNVNAGGSIGQGGTGTPLFGVVVVDLFGTGDAIATINGNIQADINGVTAIKAFGDGNVVVAGNAAGTVAGTGQIGTLGTPVTNDGIFVLHFNGDGNTTVNMAGAIFAVDDGIQVIRFNGDGNVAVTSGAITATDDGIQVIRFNGDGNVSATANGVVNAGDDGIQVIHFNGDGNTSATAQAAVNAVDDGIQVIRFNGDGNVDVTAAGAITAGDEGIQVIRFNGDGNVTVSSQAITATEDGIQVIRFNGDGNVSVTANGTVTSNTEDGIQVIHFNGDGNTSVSSQAVNALQDGIQVIRFNGDGNVDVTAAGAITAGDEGIQVIRFNGDGNVTVSSQAITATEDGIQVIRFNGDGNVSVTANGTVTSNTEDGIQVIHFNGDGNTSVSSQAVNALQDGIQVIRFNGDGNVDVTAAGAITAGDEGIQVIRFNGDGNVTVSSQAITATEDGIQVIRFNGDGDVSVTANGTVTSNTEDGIQVIRFNGDGNVSVTAAAVNAFEDGIQVIHFNGDGNTSVTANGAITSSNDDGIQVIRFNGDGNVNVALNAGATSINAADDGIQVIRFNGDGDVNVTSALGAFTNITAGDDGIQVVRFNGDGNVNVNFAGNITANDDGIQVIRFNGDGNVDIIYNGAINAGDDGIQVVRFNGDGDVNVSTGTLALLGSITANDDGIQVIRFNGDGNVTVNNNLPIFAGDDGIQVTRTRGDGNVTVNTSANITAGDDAIRIFKRAGDDGDNAPNDVFVNVFGANTVVQGDRAIYVNTAVFGAQDSAITVYNEGTLIGTGSFTDPTIRLLNDGDGQNGKVHITNADTGLITTAGGAPDGIIIRYNGVFDFWGDAGITIDNFGTMNGRILLFTNGEDPTVNNYGLWNTSGNNVMGGGGNDVLNNFGAIFTSGNTTFRFNGGDDTVNNLGLIDVDGTARFRGVQFFNNDGLIEMRDGATDDSTKITGRNVAFAGLPNSELGVDAFLGGNGSIADTLKIGRPGDNPTVSGRTEIIVNDVNPGPGAFNNQGITIVAVATTNDPAATPDKAFVLSKFSDFYNGANGGVLSKGVFDYFLAIDRNDDDPACKGGVNCTTYALYSIPGLVPRQLGFALEAAQNLWWESALLYEDRALEIRGAALRPPGLGNVAVANLGGAGADLPLKARPPVVAPPVRGVGVWLKGMGSWADRSASDIVSAQGKSFTFDTGYEQKSYGIVGGVDAGSYGVWRPGDTVSVGIMGGYLNSKVNFDAGGTSFKYDGGTFGVSASYISAGGFYADVLGKADFLNLSLDTPAFLPVGLGSVSTNVWTAGAIGEVGYRFSWGLTGWFVEPHAILGYAKTNIDDLNFANQVGSNVNWGNGDSLRGAIGARLGALHLTATGYRIEGSIVGRIWDEFLGDNNTIDITAANLALGPGSLGAYGEVKGIVNFSNPRTGWGGFVNAGVKFNDDFTAATVKGGVRYEWGGVPWTIR